MALNLDRVGMATRIFFILLLIAFQVSAQDKDYPRCKYSRFKNGKVSTSECFDTDNRWGRARAFNSAGKEIYNKELRRIGGHSSVEFSYYNNGAVKKAHWSSAPDGGIQWYRTTTYFSEDGKITSEIDDSYDKGPGTFIRNPGPGYTKHEKPKVNPKPATTVECAVIYSSEFWFTNTTRYTVEVDATRNNNDHFTITLKPRETLKGGYMIGAERFEDPSGFYKFSVKPTKEGIKQKFIIIPSDKKPENPVKEVRRYYYEVRRIV